MEKYIYYTFDTSRDNLQKKKSKQSTNDIKIVFWKPRGFKVWPKNFLETMKEMRRFPIINMVFWWFLYKIIYRNNDYSILLITVNNEIIHYTIILPKNYRFPFANKKDLILGPVWTNQNYRKQGLVYLALNHIVNKYKNDHRNLWWISNEDNIPSRITIEKAGFTYYGVGNIENNNKIKIFSYFNVKNKVGKYNEKK